MTPKIIAALAVGVSIPAGVWLYRTSAPQSLHAAGVHKCVGAGGTTYLDRPCPSGTHEAASNGGTMTVTSFPKPAPTPASLASAVFGGPLVKPMDPEERDRLRDKAIEDAANRK